MATSLLALLDDIASVLDDVAILTKVASKKSAAVIDDVAALTKVATRKTAGVLGDDLALNAQQVSGVRAHRELPVVRAVAKGSLVNKAILVPAALAISAFVPWLVTPLLILGGLFLCYEGFEKLVHKFFPSHEDQVHKAKLTEALVSPDIDLLQLEKDKIKGAIRTDFILSAEIIVIALGTVATETFGMRVAVLVGIALLMTVGVYGLVAGIVKLDDLGLWLASRASRVQKAIGRAIVAGAPWLMKLLSIAGTAAMFLVGGGILSHGIPTLEHWISAVTQGAGTGLGWLAPTLANALVGVVAGAIVFVVVKLVGKLRAPRTSTAT